MIKPAIADIVRPAISSDNPLAQFWELEEKLGEL